jgi:hypothetical protein
MTHHGSVTEQLQYAVDYYYNWNGAVHHSSMDEHETCAHRC